MTRTVFTLLVVVAGCDQASTESNQATSQRALTEQVEVAAVGLGDEVPLHEQETPDPLPPIAPAPVDLDLEEALAQLAATPEGAAALASVGRPSADGPRQAMVPAPRDDEHCLTGAHPEEIEAHDSESAGLVGVAAGIRDRSSVPLLTRLGALPAHDLEGYGDAVAGPEVPTPLTY